MTQHDRCQVRVDRIWSSPPYARMGPCLKTAVSWNLFPFNPPGRFGVPFPLCEGHVSCWSVQPGRVIMDQNELEIWLIMDS